MADGMGVVRREDVDLARRNNNLQPGRQEQANDVPENREPNADGPDRWMTGAPLWMWTVLAILICLLMYSFMSEARYRERAERAEQELAKSRANCEFKIEECRNKLYIEISKCQDKLESKDTDYLRRMDLNNNEWRDKFEMQSSEYRTQLELKDTECLGRLESNNNEWRDKFEIMNSVHHTQLKLKDTECRANLSECAESESRIRQIEEELKKAQLAFNVNRREWAKRGDTIGSFFQQLIDGIVDLFRPQRLAIE